jgi:dihydroorotate dehydrogenase (NAD+) catalytic subunit
MNLATGFCGIRLSNPTILASGIMGVSSRTLERAALGGAGAVTIKSVSIEERMGHSNPTMFSFGEVFMNAVGYSNPGVEVAREEFGGMKLPVPVIGSVIGKDASEFAQVLSTLGKMPFSAIEIPLSCPHTPGFGLLAGQGTPEATSEITRAVKKATRLPVIVKLSPSSPDLVGVAKAAEAAGADAINMGNTHGPGMKIDIETAQPIMHFKVGGVSGPAIRPLTVRCVYDLYESVKIPIIGTGGITYGRDAIEMLMAGASCLGVGTAVYYRGFDCFRSINSEMSSWMASHGYSSIKELVGAAHG